MTPTTTSPEAEARAEADRKAAPAIAEAARVQAEAAAKFMEPRVAWLTRNGFSEPDARLRLARPGSVSDDAAKVYTQDEAAQWLQAHGHRFHHEARRGDAGATYRLRVMSPGDLPGILRAHLDADGRWVDTNSEVKE